MRGNGHRGGSAGALVLLCGGTKNIGDGNMKQILPFSYEFWGAHPYAMSDMDGTKALGFQRKRDMASSKALSARALPFSLLIRAFSDLSNSFRAAPAFITRPMQCRVSR